MITWKPFTCPPCSPLFEIKEQMKMHQSLGDYVLVTFVPGLGWAGAYGTYDAHESREEVEVTELLDDRHVKICAFSKPEGADNPPEGGPHRAA